LYVFPDPLKVFLRFSFFLTWLYIVCQWSFFFPQYIKKLFCRSVPYLRLQK
jgi:hypothetical protein